jgi:hypothetical protein
MRPSTRPLYRGTMTVIVNGLRSIGLDLPTLAAVKNYGITGSADMYPDCLDVEREFGPSPSSTGLAGALSLASAWGAAGAGDLADARLNYYRWGRGCVCLGLGGAV